MSPAALAALDSAVESLRRFSLLAYQDDAVAFTLRLANLGKFTMPLEKRQPAIEPPPERPAPTTRRRGERRPAVLAALDRAERPLTRKEISERARVTDNSKPVLLLQELVEVARIVIRTDDNRYWLSSRTLP